MMRQELLIIGVTVHVEGVLSNVEDITVVNGGENMYIL